MHAPLALLPIVYGLADRGWGAEKPAFKGKKAVIALAVLGGGYLLGGVTGLLFGLAWFVWRSVPFFGGSGAPQTAPQRVAAIARHLPIILPVALIADWRGLPEPQAAGVFVIWAACAVGLAIWYGGKVSEAKDAGRGIGNQNVAVELSRGVLYGLAVIAALSL